MSGGKIKPEYYNELKINKRKTTLKNIQMATTSSLLKKLDTQIQSF